MARKVMNGLDLQSQRIVSLGDPSGAQDGATKNYVDLAVQGIAWKAPVRVATTASITLSGTQTIDGVAVVAGDRVLVKNQATAGIPESPDDPAERAQETPRQNVREAVKHAQKGVKI